MICGNNLECFVGNLKCEVDILVAHCGIHKVVVVAGEEDTSLDTFGNPLLVEHHGVVVCYSEVEECGLTGNDKVEAVVFGGVIAFLLLKKKKA